MSADKQVEQKENTGLRLEAWKFVFSLRPGPGGESPDGWREVWKSIQRNLKAISANLVGVIADTLDAARALLQGLAGKGGAVGAVTSEVTKPDDVSELIASANEEVRQRALAAKSATRPSILEVQQQLTTIAEKAKRRGGVVVLERVGADRYRVLIVTPSGIDAARRQAQEQERKWDDEDRGSLNIDPYGDA
jgi:hypothetical protein